MIASDKQKYRSVVRNMVAFKYFGAAAMDTFFGSAEIHTYHEDDQIIVEGSKSPYFYAVVEGTVNVSVHESERDVFICAIGEGELFGEAAIFASVKRTASVRSAGESVILRIHRDNLIAFIRSAPTDGVKFLMIVIFSLLRKLRDANQELAFERKFDVEQDDVDAMVRSIMADQ